MYKTVVVSAQVCRVRNSYGTMGQLHDYYCDPEELGRETQRACNELLQEGFEVISIVPVSRSIEHFWGQGGAGTSFTGSMVVTGKKIVEGAEAPPRMV